MNNYVWLNRLLQRPRQEKGPRFLRFSKLRILLQIITPKLLLLQMGDRLLQMEALHLILLLFLLLLFLLLPRRSRPGMKTTMIRIPQEQLPQLVKGRGKKVLPHLSKVLRRNNKYGKPRTKLRL